MNQEFASHSNPPSALPIWLISKLTTDLHANWSLLIDKTNAAFELYLLCALYFLIGTCCIFFAWTMVIQNSIRSWWTIPWEPCCMLEGAAMLLHALLKMSGKAPFHQSHLWQGKWSLVALRWTLRCFTGVGSGGHSTPPMCPSEPCLPDFGHSELEKLLETHLELLWEPEAQLRASLVITVHRLCSSYQVMPAFYNARTLQSTFHTRLLLESCRVTSWDPWEPD